MIIIMQIEGLESLNSVTNSDETDTDGLKRIKKWIYCRGLNDFFLVNKICSFSIHFEPPHRTAVSICDVRISDRETRLERENLTKFDNVSGFPLYNAISGTKIFYVPLYIMYYLYVQFIQLKNVLFVYLIFCKYNKRVTRVKMITIFTRQSFQSLP